MLMIAQTSLLWFSAIGCAVIGGVYFTFSTFAMTAFAKIEQASGIAAMQAINDVILRSLFMPLFFGTTIAAAILVILGVINWSAPSSLLLLTGGLVFVAGMFMVTVVFNVPMNDGLAAVTPANADAVWKSYLSDWTFWNHVRTIASLSASVLFMVALTRG